MLFIQMHHRKLEYGCQDIDFYLFTLSIFLYWHLGAADMSSIQHIVYSIFLTISVCHGYPENENRMNFKTDNGKRIVLGVLSTNISTESYLACASLCLLDEDCCLSSYDKTYKQCRLVAECNPDTETWQNGIVTRKIGKSETSS